MRLRCNPLLCSVFGAEGLVGVGVMRCLIALDTIRKHWLSMTHGTHAPTVADRGKRSAILLRDHAHVEHGIKA